MRLHHMEPGSIEFDTARLHHMERLRVAGA